MKTWKITADAPVKETWDGLVKKKIVAGHYLATVTYTNPDATTATASSAVVVSAKKAIVHTWSKKVTAWGVVDSCASDHQVSCSEKLALVAGSKPFTYKYVSGVELYSAGSGYDPTTEEVASSVALPSAVRAAAKVRMYVSGSVSLSGAKGHTYFISTCTSNADGCRHTHSITKSGSAKSPALTLESQTRASWLATISGQSKADIIYYTVHVS